MTSDLEKMFFETFGIVKHMDCICNLDNECPEVSRCEECEHYNNPERTKYYPEITDRNWIELYCKLCDAFNLLNIDRRPAFAFNVEDFKAFVLKDLICISNYFKNKDIDNKIRNIFGGKDEE